MSFSRRNWSTIVANTPFGADVMSRLSPAMQLRPCSIADIVRYNPLFAHQTWFSQDRDAFFTDFAEDRQNAMAKWTVPFCTYKAPLKKTIVSLLPTPLVKLAFLFSRKKAKKKG